MTGRLSFFYLLILFPLTVKAQQGVIRGGKTVGSGNAATGNTYAIIIGISDYKSVPDLKFAHKDALAFQALLQSQSGENVPKENIEIFINDKATKNNVADAISQVVKKVKSGDRIWFFFAGHGDMEDYTQVENGLLLLYNSPNGNYFGMKDDVLEIIDLKRYLSPLSLKGVELIFVLDACHAGNLSGGIQGLQQTASALATSWGKEYKILSCQPDQLSEESEAWGGGRGLFSLHFEEGVKGLADENMDGKITLFELQKYVQSNVAKYSEYKQIPLITGDLNKSFFKVNPEILAALKKEKELNFPRLAAVNIKGMEQKYLDSLSPEGHKIWQSFSQNIEKRNLILPKEQNAMKDYRKFEKLFPKSQLTHIMRRELAAALNSRFDSIVIPLLEGKSSSSNREECALAAIELDSCMRLLGKAHFMYKNLEARKLYMEAQSLTWALSENEYNFYWIPKVERALKLLQQSAALEPNASYTILDLGIHHYYLGDFGKAQQYFERYLKLIPKSIYARYNLAETYTNLKLYDKAEELLLSLQNESNDMQRKLIFQERLLQVYIKQKNREKAEEIVNRMISDEEISVVSEGYFKKGFIFFQQKNYDSAVFYYHLTRRLMHGNCISCDNNIGFVYFLKGQYDSARKYYQSALKLDSNYAHSLFNLGVVEEKEGNIKEAFQLFNKASDVAPVSEEGFLEDFTLYLGKTYHSLNPQADKNFREKIFNIQLSYFSYVSLLYLYLRYISKPDVKVIEKNFRNLFSFKNNIQYTWYHYACYKSLMKDKNGALAGLKKALDEGYNGYYELMCDADLDYIRNDIRFTSLIKKYFPEHNPSDINPAIWKK
ncbi:MAG: caspase family protein [Chitinophagaceae bacterium]|nr:caspase family protein [Chitinophagaceae bacterium]